MDGVKPFRIKNGIRCNQKRFLAMECAIENEPDLEKRCKLAYEAALFAVTHTTDIFASPAIERTFIELAQKHSVSLASKYQKGTILHVMTMAYTTGGHTRCVERFAQILKEFNHSCVLLDQQDKIPQQLDHIMQESGGSLKIYDPQKSMLERALDLRKYASNFEYIILHIHMQDPTALIAFGTEDFKRPVIFFNHANHTFWLGISITDQITELSKYGQHMNVEYRGCDRSSILGVPMSMNKRCNVSKESARKKIGVPLNKKMIFSAGHELKYRPVNNISFYDIVSAIIRNSKSDIVFCVAGIVHQSGFWRTLKRRYPNNVLILGQLDSDTEYPYYLAAADLIIDSWPVGGGTFIIDAITAGKPVLSLFDRIQFDYLLESRSCCHSFNELINKALKILSNSEFADEIYEDIKQRFIEKHSYDVWSKRFYDIISELPQKHSIYGFNRTIPDKITDCSLQCYMWIEGADSFFMALMKNILKSVLYINISRKKKVIRLFGIYLLNKHVR